MKHDPPTDRPAEDDEIEILEIVGFDEDAPPTRSRRTRAPAAPRGQARGDVVVDPQTEGENGSRPPREGPDRASDSTHERLVRLSADFENYRKRVEREREALERHAGAALVERLLPVLDNFERALSTRRPPPGGDGFHDGVALIFRQLLDELRKEGLSAVDSVGEVFDPAWHEAVATTVEPALEPNIVVEELQRGYRLHQRLLRPALVRVTVDPDDPRAGGGSREPQR